MTRLYLLLLTLLSGSVVSLAGDVQLRRHRTSQLRDRALGNNDDNYYQQDDYADDANGDDANGDDSYGDDAGNDDDNDYTADDDDYYTADDDGNAQQGDDNAQNDDGGNKQNGYKNYIWQRDDDDDYYTATDDANNYWASNQNLKANAFGDDDASVYQGGSYISEKYKNYDVNGDGSENDDEDSEDEAQASKLAMSDGQKIAILAITMIVLLFCFLFGPIISSHCYHCFCSKRIRNRDLSENLATLGNW